MTTWITGASSGIGRALALRLARDGGPVVISARNAAALAEVVTEGAGRIHAWPLDTTDSPACTAAVDGIEAAHGPIARAILNAGTHMPMSAGDFDAAKFARLIDINLQGTANCLDPLLARMRARRAGHIAVVSSIAGYRGLPTAAAYGASKAALINMCEALRPECERLGIKLQVVNPGFVKTPLTDRNEFPIPFLMPVERAVERFVRGLASNRFEIVFPRRFCWLLKLARSLPYPLYFAITRRTAR